MKNFPADLATRYALRPYSSDISSVGKNKIIPCPSAAAEQKISSFIRFFSFLFFFFYKVFVFFPLFPPAQRAHVHIPRGYYDQASLGRCCSTSLVSPHCTHKRLTPMNAATPAHGP